MSDFPDDWFRGGQQTPPDDGAGDADQTISVSRPDHPGGQYRVGQYADPGPGGGQPGQPGQRAPQGGWPSQPPARSDDNVWARGFGQAGTGPRNDGRGGGVATPDAPPRSGGGRGFPGAPRHWWRRPRRIFGVLALVLVVLLAGVVSTYFYFNGKLHRADILADYAGRPAIGSGTNWLIAGSDSRQGLTKKQERRFSTGPDAGSGRSDTIMILHIPASGRPLLISIPRDSYVNIPGHGMDKINAAYSIGGVRICLSAPLHDKASGLHLSKGCHVLSGGQSLAYVRDRHDFATQDLQREQDQRIFLKALLTKVTSPGVMLNPFSALPAASGVVGTLTVDQGTSLYQLISVAMAMRDPQTTTVPIANANYPTAAGDAVLWDSSQATRLWNDLNSGQHVPKSLITGSHQGT